MLNLLWLKSSITKSLNYPCKSICLRVYHSMSGSQQMSSISLWARSSLCSSFHHFFLIFKGKEQPASGLDLAKILSLNKSRVLADWVTEKPFTTADAPNYLWLVEHLHWHSSNCHLLYLGRSRRRKFHIILTEHAIPSCLLVTDISLIICLLQVSTDSSKTYVTL